MPKRTCRGCKHWVKDPPICDVNKGSWRWPAGWGTIVLRPGSRSQRDRYRDLGLVIHCVSLMTSFDNQIERSRSGEPDLLVFRKRCAGGKATQCDSHVTSP